MYATDYETANDFLQVGFMKVFQNLHQYTPTGNLKAWIRRIIVNNNIDMIRKDHWNKNTISINDFNESIEIAEEEVFEPHISTQGFLDIILKLPVGYRTIINLFFLEGYTHKEISQKLNITEGTSKSQLSKAKKYLKKLLLESLQPEEIELYVGRLDKKVV